MSDISKKLIDTIYEFIDKSSKQDYVYSEEEDYHIIRAINTLNSHLNMLVKYELEQRKEVK